MLDIIEKVLSIAVNVVALITLLRKYSNKNKRDKQYPNSSSECQYYYITTHRNYEEENEIIRLGIVDNRTHCNFGYGLGQS